MATTTRAPPTTATPNGALAIFWDDRDPSAARGVARAAVSGTAPHRVVTLE